MILLNTFRSIIGCFPRQIMWSVFLSVFIPALAAASPLLAGAASNGTVLGGLPLDVPIRFAFVNGAITYDATYRTQVTVTYYYDYECKYAETTDSFSVSGRGIIKPTACTIVYTSSGSMTFHNTYECNVVMPEEVCDVSRWVVANIKAIVVVMVILYACKNVIIPILSAIIQFVTNRRTELSLRIPRGRKDGFKDFTKEDIAALKDLVREHTYYEVPIGDDSDDKAICAARATTDGQ